MTRRGFVRVLAAVALIAVGAVGGAVWTDMRASALRSPASPPSSPSPPPPAGASRPPDGEPVEIVVAPSVLERAGIKVAAVTSDRIVETLSVPATVMSNAYRETRVNALVGGIVTQVTAELGAPVRRGQALAVVFSNDLAEAQMKYLSMQAMLEADRQKRQRTERLMELGAASREEMEEAVAIHDARQTELAAARQRLLLLGLSPDQVAGLRRPEQIVSEVAVPAPADGVVIAREVNPGQVAAAGQELFVVTDLRTVWVIGDLYERDFERVRVGAPAAVTIPAASGRVLRGRVAYIDPRVDAATRTAKVRVEVANPSLTLRLGMYVTVGFESAAGQKRPVIPRGAVQAVGDRFVVYVPVEDAEGTFVERVVTLGDGSGDRVQVVDGLQPGEQVVTEGSFFLRAEAARTRSGG